jgi:hypothetical protein
MPEDMNLDLKLDNFPFKTIAELGKNTAQSVSAQPHTAPFATVSLMSKIPVMLSQAGAIFNINESYALSNLYKIELTGNAKADATAVTNIVSTARMKFHGLDAVLDKSQKLAADTTNPDAAKFRDMAARLTLLKNIGKREGDIYIFDFEMNPQGQMLLNGQDFMGLVMRGGSAPAAAPAPAVVPVTP